MSLRFVTNSTDRFNWFFFIRRWWNFQTVDRRRQWPRHWGRVKRRRSSIRWLRVPSRQRECRRCYDLRLHQTHLCSLFDPIARRVSAPEDNHIRDLEQHCLFVRKPRQLAPAAAFSSHAGSDYYDEEWTHEATTRSEHDFVYLCRRIMKYETLNEIILSDPGDRPECGYFIPVSWTLSSLFHHPQILPLVSRNLKSQRKCATYDDESLLIQLYIDDIGLTNPIGSRKDRHKMTMVYFLLEDMPDKHRSQVQSINLLVICPRGSLKVREILFIHLAVFTFFQSEGPTQVKAFFPTDRRRSKRLARAWP